MGEGKEVEGPVGDTAVGDAEMERTGVAERETREIACTKAS